jgi:hypothetical protein
MTQYEIHISDVLAFKSCRRKWDYSSLLRRNLTPIGIYAPFFTGRVIHGALDALYRYGINPADEVIELVAKETKELQEKFPTVHAANVPTINEQMALCVAILEHYMQWRASFRGKFNDNDLDFLNVEQAFNVPMRTNRGFLARSLRLAGRFDGIVRHKKDDQLYLWEVKTTRSIAQRLKQLDLEEQADAYCIAAQELLQQPIAGVIYTLIRKAVPQSPQVLKNGFLSQNKAIDTTFAHYLAAIRSHHGHIATNQFIQETYGDFLQHLLDNGNPFFERVMIRRSQAQLKSARNELYAVALEMTRPSIPIYKHGQIGCNWCIVREPCIAQQQGQIEFSEKLLHDNFTQNTYHQRTNDDE